MLVVQTLANHYVVTSGSETIPALEHNTSPVVALALCACAVRHFLCSAMFNLLTLLQVERALTLCRDGHITLESYAAYKSRVRASPIIKLGTAAGKETTKGTDFNHANWGDVANGYLSGIKSAFFQSKLESDRRKMDQIIEKALDISKDRRKYSATSAVAHENANERALLRDDSDFSSDGSDN